MKEPSSFIYWKRKLNNVISLSLRQRHKHWWYLHAVCLLGGEETTEVLFAYRNDNHLREVEVLLYDQSYMAPVSYTSSRSRTVSGNLPRCEWENKNGFDRFNVNFLSSIFFTFSGKFKTCSWGRFSVLCVCVCVGLSGVHTVPVCVNRREVEHPAKSDY